MDKKQIKQDALLKRQNDEAKIKSLSNEEKALAIKELKTELKEKKSSIKTLSGGENNRF